MQLEEYLEFGLVQNLCRYCTGKKTMGGAGTHTGHTGHKRITRTVRLSGSRRVVISGSCRWGKHWGTHKCS